MCVDRQLNAAPGTAGFQTMLVGMSNVRACPSSTALSYVDCGHQRNEVVMTLRGKSDVVAVGLKWSRRLVLLGCG